MFVISKEYNILKDLCKTLPSGTTDLCIAASSSIINSNYG
jgi:hypothetical protein